jgi:hypothetical protein
MWRKVVRYSAIIALILVFIFADKISAEPTLVKVVSTFVAAGVFFYFRDQPLNISTEEFTKLYVPKDKQEFFKNKVREIFSESTSAFEAYEIPRLGILLVNCGATDKAITMNLKTLGFAFMKDIQKRK